MSQSAAGSEDEFDLPPPSHRSRLLLRQLPYLAMLALTFFGVGYTSFGKEPLIAYWEFMAVLMAVVCIAAGWPRARQKGTLLELIWTQIVHWVVFLVAMNLVLLPSVQRIADADTIGLTLLLLLALGTFISGLHILSWQICLLGIVMAMGVPAIAWLENAALLLFLMFAVLIAVMIAGAIWWRTVAHRGDFRNAFGD